MRDSPRKTHVQQEGKEVALQGTWKEHESVYRGRGNACEAGKSAIWFLSSQDWKGRSPTSHVHQSNAGWGHHQEEAGGNSNSIQASALQPNVQPEPPMTLEKSCFRPKPVSKGLSSSSYLCSYSSILLLPLATCDEFLRQPQESLLINF